MLVTEQHEQLEQQQGFFVYERQNFSFDLAPTQKLYVRSYKENDICLFTNMVLHNETSNTVLSNKALLEVDKMRTELNTMREVYPIGFTALRNEEESSTLLQLKKVKENFN